MTLQPSRLIRICHVAPADGWAGAEVQAALLLPLLARMADLDVSAVLFNDGRLAHELNSAGITTHVVPESRHNAVSITTQLARHFRRHPVDIVHTHKWKDNVVAAVASAGKNVRCQVRTIHGCVEPFAGLKALKVRGVRALDYVANRWAVNRIITVSRDLTEEFGSRFGVGKVTYVQNGIDLGQVRRTRTPDQVRAELGFAPGTAIVGTMGRLMPVKGLDVFLEAARRIRDRRNDVKFVIAGSGPLERALQAQAERLDLGDVRFLGHRNDSYDVLAAMDVFVLPSLNEGIPMVLLEALALSRPVVASRVGGIPDIIEHDVSGVLTEPANVEDVARECLSLLEDREKARRLAIAGRAEVEHRFSAGVMASQMAAVYRTLVANERTARSLAVRTGDVS